MPGREQGLRKSLCPRLADQGATAHEILAWSGRLTLEEVEIQTRTAEKAPNADAGLAKLTRKEETVHTLIRPTFVAQSVPPPWK